MVNIDGSIFIQIINFVVLIFILNAVLYRPIRNILVERKKTVTGLEKEIDGFKKSAEEKAAAFASGVRDARVKGLKEKEILLKAAADEEKEIINRINEKAQADLTKIREQISMETESVRASLMKQIDAFAVEIGQKILGRAV